MCDEDVIDGLADDRSPLEIGISPIDEVAHLNRQLSNYQTQCTIFAKLRSIDAETINSMQNQIDTINARLRTSEICIRSLVDLIRTLLQ